MKKIKVSIITPYYNASKYIIETLISVSSQVHNENLTIEHVLINDWSSDNSKELVDNFIESQNELGNDIEYKHITTPMNLGCGGARKYGIDNSTGDYLMFVDADDYYENDDFVQRATQTIIEENADIVEFGVKYLNFFLVN